ncbi:ABC transporter ATP-binding protein [Henriciella marina]|uniref:ABC transporter ATP-binding protein n=2 Tax=Henriciella marina TaxID=453851 RepID=A0ABT4LX68_9PROT|nr:ABC transporter ATP-binding protein [Henriciella marina]
MRTGCSTLKRALIITSDMASGPERTHSLFRLIKERFRPHLRWFVIGTGCAAVTAVAAASYGYLLKLVVEGLEDLAGPQTASVPSSLWWLIGIIGLAAALRSLSLYGMTLANNTGVQRAIVDIQADQFASLTEGDFARLSADRSGGFVSRFINDVNAIRDAGLRLANNLTKGVLTVIGVLITMFIMDWKLTLILLLVYPIAFGPVISLGNRVRKRSKRAQKQIGEVASLLSESFQSARVVKAYGLEEYQKGRAKRGFVERSRLFLKVLTDRAAVDPILEITGGLALVGILALTAWRIADGDTSLGNFVGVIGAVAVAAPEVRALGTLNAVAQEGGAAADRVFEIIDAEPQIKDRADARTLENARGSVEFRDVHFAYPDGSQALKGLSFSASPGETVALVGPSGAGKSTVFNLLLRLYEPVSGSVMVDGSDVRAYTGASLRRSTALVAQEALLFDDTVAANIALGRMGASLEEIKGAARAASAHDFILGLPGGYEAPCGEMGRNLSGGQRQRISLARAIIRQAPILLLDEATSALDAESEAKVQAALAEYAKDRTTLVIAHRLSTVRSADRIIVLDDGRVAEEGTHHDLIREGGLYKQLVELQLS